MDPTAPSQSAANTTPSLPPEAIALASRFFDAARHGQLDIFEQGLAAGLPANLTNDKGDSLVRCEQKHSKKKKKMKMRGVGGDVAVTY